MHPAYVQYAAPIAIKHRLGLQRLVQDTKRIALVALFSAISLRAGLITRGDHPNYDAQLPTRAINETGIGLGDLTRQFPQLDFSFNGGLVGHFAYGRPGQLVIWAPPVQPLDPTPEESADIDWRSSDQRPGYGDSSFDANTSPAMPLPQPASSVSTISAPQQTGWNPWAYAASMSRSLDAAAIITGTNQTLSPNTPGAVPEPGSYALVGCGLMVLLGCVRRRSKCRIVS